MSGITVGTTITQNPAPAAALSNGGGGLYGTPPALFTGDRNKSKDFMRAFNRWWKLNKEKPIFSQPYKHVALFLNHLRGLNVEDWANEQQKTMDDDVAAGHGDNDEHHWTRFKVTFKQNYTDLGEKLSANATLQNLRMEKGDIDTYIALFNKLLTQARYKDDELGTLNMFKKGLPGPLNVHIINNTSTASWNLKDWQKAAREQQLKYLETKEFTRKHLSPAQQGFAKWLRSQYGNSRGKDPNAMNVDAGLIRFQKLTDEERKELSTKGACFWCRKQGHMSRECPNKNGSAKYGRPAPTQVKKAETPPEAKTLDGLMGDLKEFLKTEENKEKYFSAMIDQGFV
jgi:hypothetical protein